MELNVLEESKTKIEFELKGETHTFCNALKEALHDVKGVTLASYKIEHPLVGVPHFVVETSGIEPRKALQQALQSLRKEFEAFKKEVKSL